MIELNYKDMKYIKDEPKEVVIDSLTDVINRNYILKIANNLIEEKAPFTLMILDLDNFKQINDSFGHLSGDFILKTIGEGLVNYCKDKAYVGRFGGDEFLILVPEITEYDDVHNFLEGLFTKNAIFRRYYNDGTRDIYLTATLGCAKFPEDATKYEELFNKADKALYRGKDKGRNCYIIYVESKHKDIIIHERAEGSLVQHFNSVLRLFDIYRGKNEIIKHTVDFIYSNLHPSGVYFLTSEHKIISNKNATPKSTGIMFEPHLEMLLKEDSVFYDSPLTKYKKNDPELANYLNNTRVHSILVSKLKTYNKCYGYIIVYEKEITRVWQEHEIALVMYISSLLEMELINNKN